MKNVSPGEYLDELNRRLRSHRAYEAGMVFVARRGGSIEIDWEPKGTLYPFSEVSSAVRKEFFIGRRV